MKLTNVLEKVKNAGKTVGLVALTAGTIGFSGCSENYGPGREIYQGYRTMKDGPNTYVFDPKSAYRRNTTPKYSLKGREYLKDSLEIGKEYFFVMKNEKEIVYILPIQKIREMVNKPKILEDYSLK